MRLSKSMTCYYQELADAYEREVLQPAGTVTYTIGEVIEWATQAGRLEFTKQDIEEVHRWRMSTSLNADATAMPDGTRVRNRYCLEMQRADPDNGGKERQMVLWAHVDTAPREFLRQALSQQMKAIGKDVLAWKANYKHVNNRLRVRGERRIQLNIDSYLSRLDEQGEADSISA